MSIRLDDVVLPEDMIWLDEAEWSPVAQETEYALSGSLLISESVKLAGYPITLGGNNAWTTWATCKQILAMSHEPGKEMVLSLADGRSFTVIFRHEDGKPVEVTRIFERQPHDTDECILGLKLTCIDEI